VAIATFDRLTYQYPATPDFALLIERLELPSGLTLVAGPSGGGKSTLLRLLNGLVPHFHGGEISGRAEVLRHDVLSTPTRLFALEVGFVFQDPERQFVHGTVELEVAFGLENLGFPVGAMPQRVDQALSQVEIGHLRRRRVNTLSGGERQRVAIAAALAMGPRLLVLDEPTSQLDAGGRTSVVAAIHDLHHSGRDVVIAEHRLELFATQAKAICHLENGRPSLTDPRSWSPELPSSNGPRPTPGEVTWSIRGITSGPGRAPVLHDIDLEGREGEVVVLRGANGSGKTTLLRTLAGLLRPISGEIRRPRGRVAYLPQDPSSLLNLPTVREEVGLTLTRAGAKEGPQEMLRALGLQGLDDRYPRDLSGGQRQRVAIAAVLAGSPSLALLDEPTRGMDRPARIALGNLTRELADRGASVVIATHDALLTAEVADRIVDIKGGRIQ